MARTALTGSSIMEGLLTLLLSDKLGVEVKRDQTREPNPMAERLRDEIRQSIMEKGENKPQSGATPPAAPPAPPSTLPPAPTPPPAGPAKPPVPPTRK